MVSRSSFEVIWLEVAYADLDGVIDFVAEKNPERALEIFQRVKTRVASLRRYPYRCRIIPELKAIGLDLYRELIVPPYRIPFRIRGKQVVILGFFDGRRDLEDILFERWTRS